MNFLALDLNLLRVFDAVMVEQNLTRAADKLAMTQPAVSNSLKWWDNVAALTPWHLLTLAHDIGPSLAPMSFRICRRRGSASARAMRADCCSLSFTFVAM